MSASPISCHLSLKAEESSSAPDTDLPLRPLNAARGKLIEDRPRKAPVKTRPNRHIGPDVVANGGPAHDKRMVRAQSYVILDIAVQPDHLILGIAFNFSGNDDERHVIDFDPAAFNRRDKPIASIRFAAQYAREKLDQSWPGNQPTFVIPASVSRDPDVEFLRRWSAHITQHIAAVTTCGGLWGGPDLAFRLPVHIGSLA
jgi:hypothetical protein